jgi:hypothetical protein
MSEMKESMDRFVEIEEKLAKENISQDVEYCATTLTTLLPNLNSRECIRLISRLADKGFRDILKVFLHGPVEELSDYIRMVLDGEC